MTYIDQVKSGDVLLRIHVQPKSSRNKIVGLHGDALKISITAPPTDGKANSELIVFLAKKLGIPKADISLKSGRQSRNKSLLLSGITVGQIKEKLTG